MNASTKLAVYGVAVLAAFSGAFVVGNSIAPVGLATAEPIDHRSDMDAGDGLPGLASTTAGFGIVPSTDVIAAGRPANYEFSIVENGSTVTEFDVEHTKRMHLIVVRRDFVGFRHEHPTMRGDGTWSTDLDLEEPGAYRVFADFVVDGEKHTVGTDLFVPGHFDPRELPAPEAITLTADGYAVELHGDLVAGDESELSFTVRRDGRVVTDLADHLGARGHLVALRDGDLAYLHVHADEDQLAFETDFPTAGQYRLVLQFEHGGLVRTASFTVDVEEA